MNIKLDLDTIFYIVVSIIIIAASTLGRKRKKTATQIPRQEYSPGEDKQPFSPEILFNPADFLKNTMMQATNLEDQYMKETGSQSLEEQYMQETEAQSLEEIIDEEELIPDEEAANLSPETVTKQAIPPEPQPVADDKLAEVLDERRIFHDADDLRRAVIYSEILRRPDY